MKAFLTGAVLVVALMIGMLVVLETAAVSQVERYSTVSTHVGEQQGGHVIIQEHIAAN